MRRPLTVVLCCALLIVVLRATGCGSSGRELRPPVPNAVSPTRSVSITTPPATETTLAPSGPASTEVIAGGGTTITVPEGTFYSLSPAFGSGEPIPAEFSCNGPSIPLTWKNVPEGAVELALTVVDQNNNFVHWIVTGIAPTEGSFEQGQLPLGPLQRPNDLGKAGWFGPCPPPGEKHLYVFSLYVLFERSNLASDVAPKDAVEKLRSAANGSSIFVGEFQR